MPRTGRFGGRSRDPPAPCFSSSVAELAMVWGELSVISSNGSAGRSKKTQTWVRLAGKNPRDSGEARD